MLVVDDRVAGRHRSGRRRARRASIRADRGAAPHGDRGLGRSYVDGMQLALREPASTSICQMDADLSHDPAHLPRAARGAPSRGDVVIGSRYVPGGRSSTGRGAVSCSAGSPTRTSAPSRACRAHDCTSGYRCWRREALAALPLDQFVSDGYSFIVEMLFVASRRGCRIVEVPITFVERRLGESKLSRAVIARIGGDAVAARRDARRSLVTTRAEGLFMLWFRDFLHVSPCLRKTRGSERLLSGIQRQRHDREHGDSRRAGRV